MQRALAIVLSVMVLLPLRGGGLSDVSGRFYGAMEADADAGMEAWQRLQQEWAIMQDVRESNRTREEVKKAEEELVGRSIGLFNDMMGASSPAAREGGETRTRRKRMQKKCAHPFGCLRQPSFGSLMDRIPKFCHSHKPAGFVHVKNSKCRFKTCNKQPTFGRPQTRLAEFCSTHKLEGYVDLKHRRCESCDRQPSYGGKDEVALRCSKHKKEVDIDKKHKKVKGRPADSTGIITSS